MSFNRSLAAAVAGLLLWASAARGADSADPALPVGTSLGEPVTAVIRLPQPAPIHIAADPVLGTADAAVTIVEFIDYECGFCQQFGQRTLPQVKAQYIDTGKLRYVARDFPLPAHSRARPAAIAAACAREQGRFWEMHDALLAAGGELADADLDRYAGSLGLDRDAFAACRAEPRHAARLDADFAAARAIGVSGTPSFLVGPSRGDVAEGRLVRGSVDFAAFEKLLAPYLKADD